MFQEFYFKRKAITINRLKGKERKGILCYSFIIFLKYKVTIKTGVRCVITGLLWLRHRGSSGKTYFNRSKYFRLVAKAF